MRRLVGTPPDAKNGKKKPQPAVQLITAIPEAIYCSAPQIR